MSRYIKSKNSCPNVFSKKYQTNFANFVSVSASQLNDTRVFPWSQPGRLCKTESFDNNTMHNFWDKSNKLFSVKVNEFLPSTFKMKNYFIQTASFLTSKSDTQMLLIHKPCVFPYKVWPAQERFLYGFHDADSLRYTVEEPIDFFLFHRQRIRGALCGLIMLTRTSSPPVPTGTTAGVRDFSLHSKSCACPQKHVYRFDLDQTNLKFFESTSANRTLTCESHSQLGCVSRVAFHWHAATCVHCNVCQLIWLVLYKPFLNKPTV